MSRLADKAKRLAEGTHKAAADAEAEMDHSLAQLDDVTARKDAAMQKLAAIHADMNEGTTALEEMVKNLTNQ